MALRISSQDGGFPSGLFIAAQSAFLSGESATFAATEHESALSLTVERIRDAERVDFFDEALLIQTPGLHVSVAYAVEIDRAERPVPPPRLALAPALEADRARSAFSARTTVLSHALEADEAVALDVVIHPRYAGRLSFGCPLLRTSFGRMLHRTLGIR